MSDPKSHEIALLQALDALVSESPAPELDRFALPANITQKLRAVADKIQRACEDARKSQNQLLLLQSILDASPSTIFAKDLEGRYIVCNKKFAQELKQSPKEVLGKSLHDFFPKEAAEKMASNDRHVILHRTASKFEEKIPHKDADHWNLVTLFPILDSNQTTAAG